MSPIEAASKLLPKKPIKEVKNDIKVFLTKNKLRQIPVAQERSERLLSKLYREEKVLLEQIANLESNLGKVSSNMRRNAFRVVEIQDNSERNQAIGSSARSKVRVTELTSAKIEEWERDLEKKRKEFKELRSKIDEANGIRKNPENYISIPANYGHLSPADQQGARGSDHRPQQYGVSSDSGRRPGAAVLDAGPLVRRPLDADPAKDGPEGDSTEPIKRQPTNEWADVVELPKAITHFDSQFRHRAESFNRRSTR